MCFLVAHSFAHWRGYASERTRPVTSPGQAQSMLRKVRSLAHGPLRKNNKKVIIVEKLRLIASGASVTRSEGKYFSIWSCLHHKDYFYINFVSATCNTMYMYTA